MNWKIITPVLILVFIILLFYGKDKVDNESSQFEILASNLDTPWAMDFLPDDKIIFTERGGRVSLIDIGKVELVGNIEVNQESESGLLGVAIDPEFEKNNFVYFYYTHNKGNRISRFYLNNELADEFILLDNIPNARFHDGGRIKFGPDGKLYATTGDATEPSSSQDVNSLAGKILRMNKDGSIPEGNPFNNYVYSFGHRNPQGIAWHPKTGELYSSEHGPSRNDEINLIIKGENYGWPTECTDKTGDYALPLRCYTEFTLAPSGIAFYENELYVAGLRGTQLRKINFGEDYKINSEEEFLSDLGRIREVVEHDGYLYISTSNRDGRGIPKENDDKIIKIRL